MDQQGGEGRKQGDTGERHQGKSRPGRKEGNEASFPELQAPEQSPRKEPASGRANAERRSGWKIQKISGKGRESSGAKPLVCMRAPVGPSPRLQLCRQILKESPALNQSHAEASSRRGGSRGCKSDSGFAHLGVCCRQNSTPPERRVKAGGCSSVGSVGFPVLLRMTADEQFRNEYVFFFLIKAFQVFYVTAPHWGCTGQRSSARCADGPAG